MSNIKNNDLRELLLPGINLREQEKYSTTAEIYDILPKYSYAKRHNRSAEGNLPEIEKLFVHRKKKYVLTLTPAKLNGKDYYPGTKEELVEDALRKIALDKGGLSSVNNQDYEVCVKTTIGAIQKELADNGHKYNWTEIKAAIKICNKVSISIKAVGGKQVAVDTSIFPVIGYEDLKDGSKSLIVIRFHPLVTESVIQGTMRLINYKVFMKYKRAISKRLHKRISHMYSQAEQEGYYQAYRILLTTILRDSGSTIYERLSANVKQVKIALDEMVMVGSLKSYQFENIYDPKRKNKILDIKFELLLSEGFIKDIRKGNYTNEQKISNNIQGQLLNLPDELEAEMNNKIFKLSKKYIESFIKKVSNKGDFDDAMLALKATRETMQKYNDDNIGYNPAALTKTALSEKWCPQSREEDGAEVVVAPEHNMADLSLEEKKIFTSIIQKIQDCLGKDVYKSWFHKLHFHGTGGEIGEFHFSFPTKFVTEYAEEHYKEKLLQIANEMDPSIQSIILKKR
jgi:hypothetical protein